MINERLIAIIEDVFGLPEELKPDDLMFSINMDSLGFLELMLKCEDAFGVDLDDYDNVMSVNWTVADFSQYVESKMQKVDNGVEHPTTSGGGQEPERPPTEIE